VSVLINKNLNRGPLAKLFLPGLSLIVFPSGTVLTCKLWQLGQEKIQVANVKDFFYCATFRFSLSSEKN
jgi:hypothetical protein